MSLRGHRGALEWGIPKTDHQDGVSGVRVLAGIKGHRQWDGCGHEARPMGGWAAEDAAGWWAVGIWTADLGEEEATDSCLIWKRLPFPHHLCPTLSPLTMPLTTPTPRLWLAWQSGG